MVKTLCAGLHPQGTEYKAGIQVHVLPINVISLKIKEIHFIVIRYKTKARYSILNQYTLAKY